MTSNAGCKEQCGPIHDRVDQEAEAMAQPADPQSVLDLIKKTYAAAEKVEGSPAES